MHVKLIATDLDGTLLNGDGWVSDANLAALAACKKQGIKIVLCTGRSAYGVVHMAKLWRLDEVADYIIGCNGAMIYNFHDQSMHHRLPLNGSIYPVLKKTYRGLYFHHFYDHKTIYSIGFDPAALLIALKDGLHYRPVTRKKIESLQFDRMMLISFPGIISRFAKKETKGFCSVPTGRFALELFHEKNNKLNGLKALGKKLNITPEEMLCFGDDYNDIEMLANCQGVAMANAKKEALLATKYQTKSNKEDGVAYFLHEHILAKDMKTAGVS
jgi:hypothetical protein